LSKCCTTVVQWNFGDAILSVALPESLTPEALETVLTRTRREFVAGARQLGAAATQDEQAEDTATCD